MSDPNQPPQDLLPRGDVDFAYSPDYRSFPCLRRAAASGHRHGLPRHQHPAPHDGGTACLRRSRPSLEYHNGLVLVTGPSAPANPPPSRRSSIPSMRSAGPHHHARRPDRIRHRIQGLPREPARSAHHTESFAAALRPPCVKTRTSSWSVKCATWRRSRSPSPRRKRVTWCSAPCTPAVPRGPSTACSTCSPPISAIRSASWCRIAARHHFPATRPPRGRQRPGWPSKCS
jgi:hypothetical protein